MSPQADHDKPAMQDYEGEADHGPDLESNSGRNGIIGCCLCCCCVIVIGVVVGLAMGAIIAYLYLHPLSIKLDEDNIRNVAEHPQFRNFFGTTYLDSLEDSWGWGF